MRVVRVNLVVPSLAVMLVLAVLAAPVATAQTAQEWQDFEWNYVKEDADDVPADWGDVKSVRVGELPDGTIVFMEEFYDWSLATGDVMWVWDFNAPGGDFQSAKRMQWVAGQDVTQLGSSGWNGWGTHVGSKTVYHDANFLITHIDPAKIGITPGTAITGLSFNSGAIIGAAGSSNFFESVGLEDYVYRGPGGASEGPVGPSVHEMELEAPSASQNFTNVTSDTYVLNFTNDLENATASFAWNATNGSIQVQLNALNSTLFEGVFEGNGSQEEVFEGVPTGAWNLTVTYTNFTGTFDFDLGPVVDAAEGASAGDGAGGTDMDGSDDIDGNATGNATLDGADDQESPGLPVVLGLTTVALIAVLRRRE